MIPRFRKWQRPSLVRRYSSGFFFVAMRMKKLSGESSTISGGMINTLFRKYCLSFSSRTSLVIPSSRLSLHRVTSLKGKMKMIDAALHNDSTMSSQSLLLDLILPPPMVSSPPTVTRSPSGSAIFAITPSKSLRATAAAYDPRFSSIPMPQFPSVPIHQENRVSSANARR